MVLTLHARSYERLGDPLNAGPKVGTVAASLPAAHGTVRTMGLPARIPRRPEAVLAASRLSATQPFGPCEGGATAEMEGGRKHAY